MNERGRWLLIAVAVGVLAGTASAIFLHTLDLATHVREAHPYLVLLLPLCGLGVAWIYSRYGRDVERGGNLLLDEIHDPKKTVPLRMTPMILAGTVLTHLFGGSAGREGTAVQMGGSIADQLAKPFKLGAGDRKVLLMMGMSAGFGSVFGVPFAGTLFGLEVLTIGRVETRLLLECALASFVAHFTCLALLVRHTQYPSPELTPFGLQALLAVVIAGVAFGVCARVFVWVMHGLSAVMVRLLPSAPVRAFTGGLLVVIGFYILGTMRFAGLGVPVIVESLRAPCPTWDFAWKIVFTALTLGSGFKGGEVTPLLFIGATFGNALSGWLALPVSMLAALGFVAVFAGAANTPWSSAVMAMEIFGWRIGGFALMACWLSFFVSSSRGIYHAQRPGRGKIHLMSRFWPRRAGRKTNRSAPR